MAGELLLRAQYAMCRCGCGALPPVATYHHKGKGIRKGERLTVVPSHQGRLPERSKPKLPDSNPGGTCRCGCGQPTSTYRYGSRRGTHLDFVQGHHQRWKAQQRALRRPQGRRLCVVCYLDRPAVAFLDNSGTCVVCVGRQRKVAEVDRRHQEAERIRQQDKSAAARRGKETMEKNGTKKAGGNFTLKPTTESEPAIANLFVKQKRR